jgi:hypothetical protein
VVLEKRQRERREVGEFCLMGTVSVFQDEEKL